MARYLDPRNDLPFKKIFGEHKHLLISFLNALLPLQAGREIVEIEYLTPEQAPRTPLSKNSIVDVKCVDSYQRYFIVEMQMAWSTIFANRMVFNASKAYVRQFDKEKFEDDVKRYTVAQPVYTLAIVNAELPRQPAEEQDRWLHHYKISDVRCPDRVIEGLEFVVVELPKFKRETWSQTDKRMAVLWLRFLKEIRYCETVPDELLQEEAIKQAISICEVGAFTREELDYYDKYLDYAMWEASWEELENTVARQDKIISEKDATLAEQAAALAEKDAALARALAELAALKNK
jgi:predicted transposase/invertase (TIGR01784 family)